MIGKLGSNVCRSCVRRLAVVIELSCHFATLSDGSISTECITTAQMPRPISEHNQPVLCNVIFKYAIGPNLAIFECRHQFDVLTNTAEIRVMMHSGAGGSVNKQTFRWQKLTLKPPPTNCSWKFSLPFSFSTQSREITSHPEFISTIDSVQWGFI